jgi:hypothetical protein
VFAFCSLFSDDEDPKRDAITACLVDTSAANEPPSQEAAMVVKSPEAPVKRGTSSRASKRLKKVTVASASLNTHRPVDDVSTASCGLLFLLLELFFSCLPLTDSDKKFVPLGTKCVEFLKAAQASRGKLFVMLCLLPVSCVFPWFFIRLSFPCSVLQML